MPFSLALSGRGCFATKLFQSVNMGVKRFETIDKERHNETWMVLVVLIKVTVFARLICEFCSLYQARTSR